MSTITLEDQTSADTLANRPANMNRVIELRMTTQYEIIRFIQDCMEEGVITGPINYEELDRRIREVRDMLKIMPTELKEFIVRSEVDTVSDLSLGALNLKFMGGIILHGTGSLGGTLTVKAGLFALKTLFIEEKAIKKLGTDNESRTILMRQTLEA